MKGSVKVVIARKGNRAKSTSAQVWIRGAIIWRSFESYGKGQTESAKRAAAEWLLNIGVPSETALAMVETQELTEIELGDGIPAAYEKGARVEFYFRQSPRNGKAGTVSLELGESVAVNWDDGKRTIEWTQCLLPVYGGSK